MKKDLIILLICLLLLLIAYALRAKLTRVWQQFWYRSTHPFNLAVLRIAVFATLLYTVNTEHVDFFAGLGPDLQYPPIPFTNFHLLPWHVGALALIFRIACWTGVAGLFTRISAIVAALTGLYLLGIPQWYGKVNHYHHLLWIVAILAFTRSGETLGIDGIWHSWKRADRHDVDLPASSIEFARPINWVLLFMGVCYIFPAIWKLVNVGPTWLLPKNIVNMAHNDWMTMGYHVPLFRLDKIPLLMVGGALFTICFELLFLPGVIYRRTRSWFGVGGILFHNMTSVSLGIQFLWIQTMYVVFVDWHNLFQLIGARIERSPITIVYDGDCNFCRRVMASLRALDLCDLLRPVPAQVRGQWAIDDSAPSPEQVSNDLYVLAKGDWFLGPKGYQKIFARSPLLWPLWLLITLPGGFYMADRIYGWAREARSDLVKGSMSGGKHKTGLRGMAIFGCAILAINIVFGFRHYVNAWPFACYPPYDFVAGPKSELVLWKIGTKNLNPMTDPLLTSRFQRNRLNALLLKAAHAQDGGRQMQELIALWESLHHIRTRTPVQAKLSWGYNSPEVWLTVKDP